MKGIISGKRRSGAIECVGAFAAYHENNGKDQNKKSRLELIFAFGFCKVRVGGVGACLAVEVSNEADGS